MKTEKSGLSTGASNTSTLCSTFQIAEPQNQNSLYKTEMIGRGLKWRGKPLGLIAFAVMAMTNQVNAQVRDGNYGGVIQCGPMLNNPKSTPWTQQIALVAEANKLTWKRGDAKFLETGSGMIESGRLTMTLHGMWNSNAPNKGSWQTVVMLTQTGYRLTGPATIYSSDGTQRVRDCKVDFDLATSNASSPHASTPANSSNFQNENIPLLGNAPNNLVQKMTDAVQSNVSEASKRITGRSSAVIPTNEATVNGPAMGTIFSTKVELLMKVRDGEILKFAQPSEDERKYFNESILAVLNNDYGVNFWPSEIRLKNGVKTPSIDTRCSMELEGNIDRLFLRNIRSYRSGLVNKPPNFFRDNTDDLNSITEEGFRIRNMRNSSCSIGNENFYQNALSNLYLEFNAEMNLYIKKIISATKKDYQETQDKINASNIEREKIEKEKARERAILQEKQEEDIKKAEIYRAGAGERNIQKMKSLGFTPNFLNSTLYINTSGKWTPLIKGSQLIGILLESKNFTQIKPIRFHEQYGFSIKQSNRPSIGFIFRIEENSAYVDGYESRGQYEKLETLREFNQIGMILQALTIESIWIESNDKLKEDDNKKASSSEEKKTKNKSSEVNMSGSDFSKKLQGDKLDDNPNAEPKGMKHGNNKINKKPWLDKDGYMHYPDGSASSFKFVTI